MDPEGLCRFFVEVCAICRDVRSLRDLRGGVGLSPSTDGSASPLCLYEVNRPLSRSATGWPA